jgi:hypothetical protein
METILSLIASDSSITAISFRQITFWGSLDHWVDGWYLRRGATYYHRLFKWGPGYAYAMHRPPTVFDAHGHDLRRLNWVTARETEAMGVRLYHYSLLFPKQVFEKSDYYASAGWAAREGAVDWAGRAYQHLEKPYRVHNVYDYPSWLVRYRGPHPTQVLRMMDEVRHGNALIEVRDPADVEALLSSRLYQVGVVLLKAVEPADRLVRGIASTCGLLARRVYGAIHRRWLHV